MNVIRCGRFGWIMCPGASSQKTRGIGLGLALIESVLVFVILNQLFHIAEQIDLAWDERGESKAMGCLSKAMGSLSKAMGSLSKAMGSLSKAMDSLSKAMGSLTEVSCTRAFPTECHRAQRRGGVVQGQLDIP